ncbi:MAG: Cd(II)/Pb(II)-responsive transcriptional regulator [bacterium]|nr:Cd(II)/Pb(II)-responsive transcriptional regulator [Burkholderiaceae bacterium]MDO8729116.1 Cd(II)/Pb(II)-responsive transcriptional regulator [bacterium]
MEFKIGELAKRSDCLVETIRFYEKKGLLPQTIRSQGNFRLYGEIHLERLQFIRHCRALDMSLDEIRNLLQFRDAPEDNCSTVNALLDKHIDHVALRIKELQVLETQLNALRQLCHSTQAIKDCGILQNLAQAENSPVKKLGSHGSGCH